MVAIEEQTEDFVKTQQRWSHKSGLLSGSYVLDSFSQAIELINLVATQAAKLNHHPTIINTYNKVTFELVTHDAQNTITSKDLELANHIVVAHKSLTS